MSTKKRTSQPLITCTPVCSQYDFHLTDTAWEALNNAYDKNAHSHSLRAFILNYLLPYGVFEVSFEGKMYDKAFRVSVKHEEATGYLAIQQALEKLCS